MNSNITDSVETVKDKCSVSEEMLYNRSCFYVILANDQELKWTDHYRATAGGHFPIKGDYLDCPRMYSSVVSQTTSQRHVWFHRQVSIFTFFPRSKFLTDTESPGTGLCKETSIETRILSQKWKY